METFMTVVVVMAMIALGVLLIHLLNRQHSERIAAFHYGGFRATARERRTRKGVE
ncbi:hypothetical protein ACIBBD_08510 [Streptomyces sp. NPDC051315]|uniref:hypothetical protein n=1 Tax=Streptomyces sp. NPDC051315 TaxID=3365650 RepID=UPI0037B2F53B